MLESSSLSPSIQPQQVTRPIQLLAADPPPPYFTPSVRDARVHALRDGRCVQMAGGHHLHMEQAEAVAAVLRPFLQGL